MRGERGRYMMLSNGPARCGYGVRYRREAMPLTTQEYVAEVWWHVKRG